ncbi:UBC-like protein [Crucibulum laeve]|uniref:UBC-like protein n=1 Tax=Crucibulum laeve TaxID=68775 RepID=A0A5C3MDC2_9AGAR|nr:UBC-like protein [Crucibulum laeve]
MASSTLNKNNSAVKRIMQEARELANDPSTDYSAAPLEDDIFEWHCTLRGPAGTEFEGGLYHFRILLPAEYPFRPPSLMMLTPNGRFELNTKICISFTSYHEELWQPAWGVRTAIIGLQGFFPLKGQAAVGVGSIEYPSSERKRLANLSREWVCPHCQQSNLELLPDPLSHVSAEATGSNSGVEQTTASETQGPAEPPHESPSTLAADQLPAVDVSKDPVTPSSATVPEPPTGPVAVRTIEPLLPTPSTSIVDPITARAAPLIPRAATVDSHSGAAEPSGRTRAMRRSSQKPPLLLDTAICILLVLLFAIICRRMV